MSLGASFFEDVTWVECMYFVFSRMPGGVTVGDSGLKREVISHGGGLSSGISIYSLYLSYHVCIHTPSHGFQNSFLYQCHF